MGGGEAGVFGVSVVAGVLTQALIAWVLHTWARHVARRHPGTLWQRMTWLPVVAFVLNLLGIALTVTFLARAFGAVNSVDPTRKAALLSDGIAHAMTFTVAMLVPAWGLNAASVALSLVGQFRAPRSVVPI